MASTTRGWWRALPVEAEPVLYRHARRGMVLQVALRIGLCVFVVATLVLLPPMIATTACWWVAALYLAGTAGSSFWLLRGGQPALRYGPFVLFMDLVAISAVTQIAAASAHDSWTSEVVLRGLFVLPVLAATQLRPGLCAGIAFPTVAVYLWVGLFTQNANDSEPTESILLRTLVIAGIAIAAVFLSRIQRARVQEIGALLADRTTLLGELTDVEERERRVLAEHLHDGALQYVLSARHDLEDARDTGDEEAFERLDQALTESAVLLRSTVTDLHPAVLEQAGLVPALQPLLAAAAGRATLVVDLDARRWPVDFRSSADSLLYSTARELIANVVKHAKATALTVTLQHDPGWARLIVSDDGVGTDQTRLASRLAAGHIGLNSRRVRVEAAGGSMELRPTTGSTGTTATVQLPLISSQPHPSPPQGNTVDIV